ncbi:MAG: thiamine diphosphokinase [Bacteroidia bacterium]
MSSHHIVREKQEPALVVANGEACSDELLGQLLEWSPYVLALDGALPRLHARGIKVDAVLGDFDSLIDKQQHIEAQHPITVVHAPDQNKTDLEKGLDYLLDHGHQAANIVWATGRRADHNMANLSNMVKYQGKLQLNIIDDYSRIYQLSAHFKKWFAAGTILSLVPIGRVEGIVSANLRYPLQNDWLELGKRIGTSNEALEDGWVEITHQSGHLLLMECYDRKQA